jgi:hypothetical protein
LPCPRHGCVHIERRIGVDGLRRGGRRIPDDHLDRAALLDSAGTRTREGRQRERLYSKFISEAAHLQLDAFGHQLDSAKAVVRIAGLVNRVRLIGGPEVVAAAEGCVNEIIESYLSPNLTLEELFERRPWRDRDPLRAFSEACRREIAGEV